MNSKEENPLVHERTFFLILSYCDERSRVNCSSLSKLHEQILSSEEAFNWRLGRLHVERGIYHVPELPQSTTWKSLFLANYKKRDLWTSVNVGSDEVGNGNKFQISVNARFKPMGKSIPMAPSRPVALPLHQRMALIRMNRKCSSQNEAFKALFQQGEWFGESQRAERDIARSVEEDENTSNTNNAKSRLSGGVHLINSNHDYVVMVDKTKGLRKFEFDKVFDEEGSQQQVYNATAMPLLADFINGCNATCFAFGQTGSGKTYSMFGLEGGFADYGTSIPETWGIIPRTCHEIFKALDFRRRALKHGISADLSVSYIEVFGNEVNDLLNNSKPCGQSRASAQRFVLDGSAEIPVNSLNETLRLLDKGESQKRKAATAMNARSSRAHSLFIVTLRQTCTLTGVHIESRLFLADLGGSEQIKKSQVAFSGQKQQDEKIRVKEAVNINLGLLSLKQCVEALRRKRHVPFADSKLTMMLSTGLGGDSRTAVIVCGAPDERHGQETISSLSFGLACKGVYSSVKNNAKMLKTLLEDIEAKISECEQSIKNNERWEEMDDKRFDDNGILIETRKKTVLVGADDHRLELARLIRQKADLTGESIEELYSENSVEAFGNFQKLAV